MTLSRFEPILSKEDMENTGKVAKNGFRAQPSTDPDRHASDGAVESNKPGPFWMAEHRSHWPSSIRSSPQLPATLNCLPVIKDGKCEVEITKGINKRNTILTKRHARGISKGLALLVLVPESSGLSIPSTFSKIPERGSWKSSQAKNSTKRVMVSMPLDWSTVKTLGSLSWVWFTWHTCHKHVCLWCDLTWRVWGIVQTTPSALWVLMRHLLMQMAHLVVLRYESAHHCWGIWSSLNFERDAQCLIAKQGWNEASMFYAMVWYILCYTILYIYIYAYVIQHCIAASYCEQPSWLTNHLSTYFKGTLTLQQQS